MKRTVVNRPVMVLRRLTVAIALAPVVAAAMIDTPVPGATRALVTLLWVLCVTPAYWYLSTPPESRRPLPFLPAVSLIYGLYYALPLTLGGTSLYEGVLVDPRWDYEAPVQLAFFGWIAMMVAYGTVGLLVREPTTIRHSETRPGYLAAWALVLLYGSITVVLLRSYLGEALISGGTFQFLISLQWIGAGLLTVLARRKELHIVPLILGIIGAICAALLMLSVGSIAPLVMLFVILGFALWIGRPSFQSGWIAGLVAVLVVSVALRGVVADFRKTAWFGSETLTTTQRVELMLGLLQARVDNEGVGGTIAHGFVITASRSSNLDLFANVVRRTPSEVPYWDGATYTSLVGAFVPRLLWPDKPRKEVGQAFGHRYGYIRWTNLSTAINFPIIVEFYANFAILGVVLGMMIVGVIYRVLQAAVNRPGQEPLVSMFGAVLLLPLLIIESDFSLTFGGIPLNAAALYLVWRMIVRRRSIVEFDSSAYATVAERQVLSGGATPEPSQANAVASVTR